MPATRALVTGRGRFLADLPAPGALHAVFVRSPHPRGRLLSLDCDAARAMPGVVVLTASELAPSMPAVNRFGQHPAVPLSQPMACDRIDWPGQALALVLADEPALAEAAAEQIAFDIDADESAEGPVGSQAGLALAQDGEIIRWHLCAGSEPAPGEVRQVSLTMIQPRVAAVALEARGLLAGIDEQGRLDVWVPTQSPARARDDIAHALGLQAAQVRVRVPDVGGAFGSKASLGPDELLVAAAAWRERRTVRWLASRSDEFLAGVHGRGGRWQAVLQSDRDGALRYLRADLCFPVGGWLPYSALVPARNAARILPGPYRLAGSEVHARVQAEPRAAVNIYLAPVVPRPRC
ncbi:MAG: molybdopterin cofactor-binding domain-containing protein [Burkholderiaceae bacterium]